ADGAAMEPLHHGRPAIAGGRAVGGVLAVQRRFVRAAVLEVAGGGRDAEAVLRRVWRLPVGAVARDALRRGARHRTGVRARGVLRVPRVARLAPPPFAGSRPGPTDGGVRDRDARGDRVGGTRPGAAGRVRAALGRPLAAGQRGGRLLAPQVPRRPVLARLL